MPTTRLETFADGVFAIAVTLLVLDIRLPEGDGSLADRLGDAWPAYVAYALSFITIGIMWANHHSIFELIDRTSHGLIVANLLLLLMVAFLPFPTKVLGDYLREGGHDQNVAAVFYSGTFTVTAAIYNLLWQTAAWNNRLIVAGREADAAAVTKAYRYGVPVYLLATLLAFWNVPLSLAVNFSLAAFYMLPRRA
ncbi:MAG: potassium channel family protein [Actinomycetota bacterium]